MKISRSLILTCVLSIVIFLLLVLYLSYPNNYLTNLDKSVNSFMPSIENSFLIKISIVFGIIFDPTSLVIISFLLFIYLWLKISKKDALLFLSANIIGAAAILIIKDIIHRARPENILINETNSSFPSGHATMAVIFFGFLLYLILKERFSRKTKIITSVIFILVILKTGFSRLYLNAHWLTDVLAGFALGLFILTLTIMLKKSLERNI